NGEGGADHRRRQAHPRQQAREAGHAEPTEAKDRRRDGLAGGPASQSRRSPPRSRTPGERSGVIVVAWASRPCTDGYGRERIGETPMPRAASNSSFVINPASSRNRLGRLDLNRAVLLRAKTSCRCWHHVTRS